MSKDGPMALIVILAVGRDLALLETRCSVLRSAGYTIMSASRVTESIDLFRDGDFDLVLLCHSVPVQDRDRIIRFIRSTGSRIPVCIVNSASRDFQVGLADKSLSTGPQDLIKEIGAVLAEASCSTISGEMALANTSCRG